MYRSIGYLSGAPRVTTRESGESTGARSHILGVIGAYQSLGWTVSPYIYGDQIDVNSTASSVAKRFLQNSTPGRVAADFARIAIGRRNATRAIQTIATKPDYVYERYAIFQSLGRTFKAKGIPWILETQGLFFHEAKHDRKSIALAELAKRFEISAYRDCDVIVAVTDTLKELLVLEAKVDPDKIVVVPNGVDTDRFNPDLLVLPLKNDLPTLGFVGGLLRWQGIDCLLQAMAKVLSAGLQFNLVIVGDGEEFQNLQKLALELGIRNFVEFVGRVDGNKVPEQIARFDIGFSGQLPSQLGGMYHSPLKIYEYMSMGKPVIASDYDDARSVIDGKNTGFLFKPGNSAALETALINAFEHPERLLIMGAKAREEILAKHSWKARVSNMISEIDMRINIVSYR